MTEQSTSEITTKPSVVDDFFSALFANNNTNSSTCNNSQGQKSSENNGSEPSTVTLAGPSTTSPPTSTNQNSSPSEITSYNNNSIKEPSQQQVTPIATLGYVENRNYKPEGSDEASVIEDQKVLDEFDEYSLLSRRRSNEPIVRHPVSSKGDSPAQILSKKDIDWSTVKPESRMLVRQLPKFADKQEILEYFSKYGEVIEVVQKNSFGFVHFENPESCSRAVQAENGKIYNGVILDLEICKRKPYFARVREDKSETSQRSLSPTSTKRKRDPRQESSRKRNYSPTRSVSPPPSYGRRNSSPKMDFQRNRQQPYDNSSSRTNYNTRLDEFGRSIDHRSNYSGRRQDTGNSRRTYNYTATPAPSFIPPRHGNEVPTVQIISWSDTFHVLLRSVENHFSKQCIRTASITLPFSKATHDELVKQMVIEGVKAIVIIDNANFVNSKVYLQVFAPNGQGGGVRYDEYASVTPVEAVNIVRLAYPQSPQQHQPYIPTQSLYLPQSQPQPNLDINALASLLNMVQPKPAATVAPSQPTIPQLLATLMNGLNTNTPSPPPASAPGPIASPPPTQQSIAQPSMAALLSTASGGNPAIAQLLLQMTSGASVSTAPTLNQVSVPQTTTTTAAPVNNPPSLNNNQLRDILNQYQLLSKTAIAASDKMQ